MQTAFLYVATVLIWGTSWFAITYQLGEVHAVVSVAHRIALAAVLCTFLTTITRSFVRLRPADHLRLFLQSLCLFSGNYLLIYAATVDLSSGLIAVVFSTMVIINALGGAAFLGMPLQRGVVIGGLVGIAGMGALFFPELDATQWSDASVRALGLCFIATFLASTGNLLAAVNVRRGINVLTSNCWGMAYGAMVLYGIALVLEIPITISYRADYLLSLFYLAFFATVLAFWAYLSLLARIGADRAAYTSLIFPVVALLVSTFLEGFQWSALAFVGLALVLGGNYLAMRRAPG